MIGVLGLVMAHAASIAIGVAVLAVAAGLILWRWRASKAARA